MAARPPSRVFRAASVVGVSLYLAGVAAFLMGTRRVPGPGPWLRSFLRPRHRSELSSITPEQGRCFVAPVAPWLTSDADGLASLSGLVVAEDGRALPHAHAAHEDIRRLGGGRYSHWGAQVYFSSSDGSDPRTNGRRYTVEESR
jgi:hypothetical protein